MSSLDNLVLLLNVGGESFGLSSATLTEVIRPGVLTRVPHSPAALLGITNLRGAALPVVSLATLLGVKAAGPIGSSKIVVVRRNGPVGLLVDKVTSLAEADGPERIDINGMLDRAFGEVRRTRASVASDEPAQPKDKSSAESFDHVFLSFMLGSQEYALPIKEIEEVAPADDNVASLPRSDQAILGVAAQRGEMTSLLSLHYLIGLPAAHRANAEGRRVLFTRLGRMRVGLVVDRIKEIIRVPTSSLDPVPAVLTRGKGESQIQAICRLDDGKRLVSILSIEKLFDAETAARLASNDIGEAATTMTDAHATPKSEAEQFVIFSLEDERYGLPIAAVREIVRCPHSLARVPHAPGFVKGVLNLRGQVIPIIDQRERFGLKLSPAGIAGRIIIISIGTVIAGFLVDDIDQIIRIPGRDIGPAPDVTLGDAGLFDRIASSADGRMLLLVDPGSLLDQTEKDMLRRGDLAPEG
ncbi:MAG: chemotaxis protein CheW [Hyphomicrobiaceae bacterium]|nr:chemotaxis protein CheW [Hyphomicrobiaceae bacterium]